MVTENIDDYTSGGDDYDADDADDDVGNDDDDDDDADDDDKPVPPLGMVTENIDDYTSEGDDYDKLLTVTHNMLNELYDGYQCYLHCHLKLEYPTRVCPHPKYSSKKKNIRYRPRLVGLENVFMCSACDSFIRRQLINSIQRQTLEV